MKKILSMILILMLLLSCALAEQFVDAQAVLDFMLAENAVYAAAASNDGDVSRELRRQTAENGQSPYAVVLTCSDSRVPPEHIFNAGIGELFVIRTAGNVVGEYELGSIEYGAEHLHARLVLVLGHSGCGAVEAALNGGAHGNIAAITDEIRACLPGECLSSEAEVLNVENSIARIRESEIMRELEAAGEVMIAGAIYDIATGLVRILE